MSMLVRSSAKRQHTFNALVLANAAIGGKLAKQFHLPDSEEPRDSNDHFHQKPAKPTRKRLAIFLIIYSWAKATISRLIAAMLIGMDLVSFCPMPKSNVVGKLLPSWNFE